MTKSTHKAEVIEVTLETHPSADALSVVRPFGGYTVVVRTSDWKDGGLGVYIPPDSVVDSSRPEFSFLVGHERIRVKKLRGVISMGLLIPAPEGSKVGDDLADYFNIGHYEPRELATAGEAERAPDGYYPVFDVDSFRRYSHVFEDSELVFISEKLHGASAKFTHNNDRMYAGSRTQWKKYDKTNTWWRIVEKYPQIEEFCKQFPEYTLYGEVYGWVQDLRYGTKPGELRFAAFDILAEGGWLDAHDACANAHDHAIPWVPTIEKAMRFDKDVLLSLAEGNSLIEGANHVREGIVVKPINERTHTEIGRVCLKIVGNGYLNKS